MIAPDPLPLILLVDDEASNLHLLRQVLQEQYRLLYAKDGARALLLVAREPPDLILLDLMMPDMTGHEVCRRLKADPASAAIPVIFVTALSDTADELAGFAAGAVDYITKPVSPPVVKARVRTHLDMARRRREWTRRGLGARRGNEPAFVLGQRERDRRAEVRDASEHDRVEAELRARLRG